MPPGRDFIRVAHVSPHVSRVGGGVWQFVRDLAARGRAVGIEPTLAGQADEFVARDTADLTATGTRVLTARRIGPHLTSYAPGLKRLLMREAKRIDPAAWQQVLADADRRTKADGARRWPIPPTSQLVHLHGGLRMWPNLAASAAARANGRPVVLSPHGMLYPQLLARSRWKKRLAAWLYDDRLLRSVDLLHATCPEELATIRAYGLTQPVAVIPPGVDPAESTGGDAGRFLAAHEARFPGLTASRRMVFLAIMDRKKGLPRLAEAWGRIRPDSPDWRLVIAGSDDYGQQSAAVEAFARAGVGDATHFVGPAYGDAKRDLLAAADLFVLPTDWENFGIVVGEALSCGVPVVTTSHTPWGWLNDAGAGWVVPPTTDALEAALRDALARSPDDLRATGERGRRAVVDRYSWDRSVADFRAAYDWLLGRGDRPACVEP